MSHLNTSYLGSLSIFLQSNEAQLSISDANKLFFLREIVNPPPNISMLIGLTSFECPYSMYNFNEGQNDSITITSSSGSHTVSVGSRNYSASELATALTTLFSTTDAINDLGFIVKVSYDSDFNKFTFKATGDITITNTTAQKELGFRNNIPSITATSITSPNIVNVSGSSSVYVRCVNLGVRNLDSRGNQSGIIGKVNIECNPNEFIYYKSTESIYYPVNQRQISHIQIELTDENNNELILNGADFSLSLTLHFQETISPKEIRKEFLLNSNLIKNFENLEEEN